MPEQADQSQSRKILSSFLFTFYSLDFFSSALCLSVSSFLLWGLRVNSSDCPPRPKSRFESPLKFGPWHAPPWTISKPGAWTPSVRTRGAFRPRGKKKKKSWILRRPSLAELGGVGWFDLVVINARSLLLSSQTPPFQLLVLALAARCTTNAL